MGKGQIQQPPLKYSMTAIDIYVEERSATKDNRNKMQLIEFIAAVRGTKHGPMSGKHTETI